MSSTPLTPVWSGRALESVQALDWSPDGLRLLVTPAEGFLFELDPFKKKVLREFPGTSPGNGTGAYLSPDRVVVPGCDGRLRFYGTQGTQPEREISLGRGWLEKVSLSADRQALAVALGRTLQVFSLEGETLWQSESPRGILDWAWHPQHPKEIVTAGDGGIWRHCAPDGQPAQPEPLLEWAGACRQVLWSRDARWIITADQGPSLHLVDLPRAYPLHIRGYPSRVSSLALDDTSRWLVTGSAEGLTVWDCSGPKGPEGRTPRQLTAHEEEAGQARALAFAPGSTWLASGGSEGVMLLFDPVRSPDALCRARAESGWTCLAWNADGTLLAGGTESGAIYVFRRAA